MTKENALRFAVSFQFELHPAFLQFLILWRGERLRIDNKYPARVDLAQLQELFHYF